MEKTKLITSGKQHSGYHEARETKQDKSGTLVLNMC